MKLTESKLRQIIRSVIREEMEYQKFFKKELEKTGKSIPQMSDEEKKAFFNKIDAAWKGKGESVDELTKAQEKLPPALKKAIQKKEKKESVNEAKLDFSKVKKGDTLIGKFPPYKEYEVISSNGKNSIIVKDLKRGNQIEINSVNNYKLKESVNDAPLGYAAVRKVEKFLSPKNKIALANAIKNGTIKTSKDLSNWKKSIKESVNESASRTAMEIGGLTGMNKDFIQKFVDTHNLDIEKVFQFVKKGNLKTRMDFVTALAGKPNNPYQTKLIKMFGESVINEDTRRVKLLGIDFKVSQMNGRIFFSFVDKKAATVQLRQVGTNKIVNHIQKRLDIAYGKGTFFFKGGDHAEFQNGYLFQRNAPEINLNKLKFESVNEAYHIITHDKKDIWISDNAYKKLKKGKDVIGYTEDKYEGGHREIWVSNVDIDVIVKSKKGLAKVVDTYAKYESNHNMKTKKFNESVNEAKLFKTLEKTGKLIEPTGGRSMNGKYYQLEGDSKDDVIHFDYDPKSKKPYGVVQIAGHHLPSQLLNRLGFRETRSWTAGVEVYIFDGNYNPKYLTDAEMAKLVNEWGKGFRSYTKSSAKFYQDRGRTSGTID